MLRKAVENCTEAGFDWQFTVAACEWGCSYMELKLILESTAK